MRQQDNVFIEIFVQKINYLKKNVNELLGREKQKVEKTLRHPFLSQKLKKYIPDIPGEIFAMPRISGVAIKWSVRRISPNGPGFADP